MARRVNFRCRFIRYLRELKLGVSERMLPIYINLDSFIVCDTFARSRVHGSFQQGLKDSAIANYVSRSMREPWQILYLWCFSHHPIMKMTNCSAIPLIYILMVD